MLWPRNDNLMSVLEDELCPTMNHIEENTLHTRTHDRNRRFLDTQARANKEIAVLPQMPHTGGLRAYIKTVILATRVGTNRDFTYVCWFRRFHRRQGTAKHHSHQKLAVYIRLRQGSPLSR